MKPILLIISAIFLFSACEKVSKEPVDNLNNGKILVVGHAGVGFESALSPFPSNTFTSIRKLIEGYGADGVEMDVQLSKDSALILYHDKDLETMTNCIGSTIDYTEGQLCECSYRTDFHSYILLNEKITTLDKVINRYQGSVYDPVYHLDLKIPQHLGVPDTARYAGLLARAINRIVMKYGNSGRIVAESGELPLLLHIRALTPTLKLIYDHSNFEEALETVQRYHLDGIVISNDLISKEQVKQAHMLGKEIVLFDVSSRKEIVEAVNKHPDEIQTDNIILLEQILTQ